MVVEEAGSFDSLLDRIARLFHDGAGSCVQPRSVISAGVCRPSHCAGCTQVDFTSAQANAPMLEAAQTQHQHATIMTRNTYRSLLLDVDIARTKRGMGHSAITALSGLGSPERVAGQEAD